MEQPPEQSVHWQPGFPVNARLTLGTLRHGHRDPAHRVQPDGALWRTARTGSGPVTYRIRQQRLDDLVIDAWGPGAGELADSILDELGARDRPEEFRPDHPFLRRAQRRFVGLRVPATGRVFEAVVPAVIAQRVVGLDALAAWTRLLRIHGELPPGPAPEGMRVPPSPEVWQGIPTWDWRQAGVDEHRSRTVVQTARHAARLDGTADDQEAAYRLMASLPGIGPWTAAKVGSSALGDADALPLGDYHLGRATGIALLGRPLEDNEIEDFYEQWRPHRYRVIRLIELTPGSAPRRAPRAPRNRPLR
jgi:3-methyladenine DNA glycosylase/8-oxoguanine DNA glycosylase